MLVDENGNERWHLSKAVPVSIILFLIGQTASVGWMLINDHFRIDALEKQKIERNAFDDGRQSEQDRRISNLELLATRLAIIEDRQNSVLRRLDGNATKLDQIIDHIGKIQK